MPAETTKGFPYPVDADPNDVPADIQTLAEFLDTIPGISIFTTAQRDALAGGDLWNGRVIYNTTTARLEYYNGAQWGPVAAPATKAVDEYAANHNATSANDVILMDATGAARTVNLPDAATHEGKEFDIKKIDASANAVTIDGDGADTIDGSASVSITKQHESLRIVSDGVNWRIT
jgi:carbon monoxide dehydrogenase subunit G